MTGKPQKTWKFGLNQINFQKTICLSEAFLTLSFFSPSPGFPKWPLHLLSHQSPPLSSCTSFQVGSFQSHNKSLPSHYSQSGSRLLARKPCQSLSWISLELYFKKKKNFFLQDRILKTQQLKETISMFSQMVLTELSCRFDFHVVQTS